MRSREGASKRVGEKVLVNHTRKTENQQKLENRNKELRHRLCLYEFGFGMIAKLLVANFVKDGTLKNKYSEGDPYSIDTAKSHNHQEAYEQTIETIGQVLSEVENSLKMAKMSNIKIKSELPTNVETQLPTMLEKSRDSSLLPPRSSGVHKPKIFIDEMDSGRNMLSGFCNIQIVENSCFLSLASSVETSGSGSLSALSTLAEVVACATSTTTTAEEFKPNLEKCAADVNDNYGVPLKKRKVSSSSTK